MNNPQSGVVRQSNPLLSGSKFSKKISMFGLMALIAASSVLTSCKKDSDEAAAPELKLKSAKALAPTAGGAALALTSVTSGTVAQSASGSIYTVTNYYVAQSIYNPSNPHAANGLYYFDFGLNDNIPGTSSTTPPSTDWDISFSGTGNADIKKNAGVSVKFLNENFATATARSASSAWAAGTTAGTTFGHNRTIWTTPLSAPDHLAAAPGHTIVGWWNYYFGNHQVIATTDLTILVRDTDGDTYAVHIKSVYNNDTPTGTPFPNNFSYLTFEYKKLI